CQVALRVFGVFRKLCIILAIPCCMMMNQPSMIRSDHRRAQHPARLPVRNYSMSWLLRAACRVYEREMAQNAAHYQLWRRQGVAALFDLTDTSGQRSMA